MRQATLPWAAPPPSIRPEHLPQSHRLLEQQDPVLLDIDTPPYQTITPPLPQELELDPQLQLDPALFPRSQDAAAAANSKQVLGISTPEPVPSRNGDLPIDMTASSSSSPCSSSASEATSSAGIPTPTQQTSISSAPEANSVLTAKPAETAPNASLATASTSSTTTNPETKPQPALHPFFRPGGPSALSIDSNDESDTENKRPTRSSHSKAPVSYREDLKAVLRADKAQESARIKEEKRQAKLEASAAKKALKSAQAEPRQSRSSGNSDADDFELLETRVVASNKNKANAGKARQQSCEAVSVDASSSSSRPNQPSKQVEPKPLSLAVKGTGAAATANPHPFFVKKPKQQPAVPPIDIDGVSGHGGDGNAAISSHSIDAKGKAPATTSTFNAPPASWSLFSTQRAASSKPKKPQSAPWPTEEDTHVVGLLDGERELLSHARSDLAVFRARWQSQPSRSTAKSVDSAPPPDFVSQLNRTRPQPHLDSISLLSSDASSAPSDVLAQIDTSRLSAHLSGTSAAEQAATCRASGQLWNDAFRPLSASACLGNEANAGYLRDWLRRLLVAAPGSVRTTDSKRKRAAVQRRVDRSRKKRRVRRGYSDEEEDSDEMADFIVDDDEEDEQEDAVGGFDGSNAGDGWFAKFAKIERKSTPTDDDGESAGDMKSSQGTAAALHPPEATTAQPGPSSQSQQQHSFAPLDRLTNCIILTGAHGSGKTASVYACAAELGYEVFELYPGMGKRSGKELLAAVGDLGRNHMVSSGGVGGGATLKHKPQPSAAAAGVGVCQSLILIEEADVLFDEDKGFWAAVVELVAESKRPVVVVCNELELVPVYDLPVQQVLEYAAPELEGQVVPWLQTVAAYMGRVVTAEQVEAMLLRLPATQRALEAEGETTCADLRQAMYQLHFGHLASVPPTGQRDWLPSLAAAEVDTRTLARAAESSSAADVFEHALHGAHAEMDAFGDAGVDASSSARQWGAWVQLVPSPLASLQQRRAVVGAGGAGAQPEYRSTLAEMHASLAGLAAGADVDNGGGSGGKVDGEAQMQRQALRLHTLVEPLLTTLRYSSSLLPPALVTDYAPMVRLMALVDEDLAQIHASLRAQQQQTDSAQPPPPMGRVTRTSRAAALTSWLTGTPDYGYERWLGALGPEQVRVAQLTRLTF